MRVTESQVGLWQLGLRVVHSCSDKIKHIIDIIPECWLQSMSVPGIATSASYLPAHTWWLSFQKIMFETWCLITDDQCLVTLPNIFMKKRFWRFELHNSVKRQCNIVEWACGWIEIELFLLWIQLLRPMIVSKGYIYMFGHIIIDCSHHSSTVR